MTENINHLENDPPMDKWYMRKSEKFDFPIWFLKTDKGTYFRFEPCEECYREGVASCTQHSTSL